MTGKVKATPYDAVTYKIIGCAMAVHRELGPGLHFVVEGMIVVEIKALRGLDNSHLAQVIGYLAVSACPVGLLINFGERSLAFRRVFPSRKVADDLVNRQWLFIPDWLKEENTAG